MIEPSSSTSTYPTPGASEFDIPAFVSIVEALPDGLIVVDGLGRIRFVNKQIENLFGYERDALLHADIEVLLPRSLCDVHEQYRARYVAAPTVRPMGSGIDLVARHRDGHEIPVEISLSPITSADGSLRILAAVRDVSNQAHAKRDRERQTRLWETMAAFTSELLGQATSNPLDLVAHHAQSLLHADSARVLALKGTNGLRTVGESGVHISEQDSLHSVLNPLLRAAVQERKTVVLDAPEISDNEPSAGAAYGSLVCAPIQSSGADQAISVTRRLEAIHFTEADSEDLARFASQVNLALELAKRRENESHLAIIEDRERIARDLHDRVIGRLFSTGLGLHTIAGSNTDPAMVERAERAIDDIDRSITDLRHAIFALTHTDAETVDFAELERLVARTLQENWDRLGFAPQLIVDRKQARVPLGMTNELMATLNEALVNVGRHAEATAVEVHLDASTEHLTMRVLDNGRGIASDHVPGNGLKNMKTRAGTLRGHSTVEPHVSGGTAVTWTVPLK